MKKIQILGWTLFILLMILFMLFAIIEPGMRNDEPPTTWDKEIVFEWLGLLLFSVLLIVIGKYRRKHKP